MPKDDLMEGIEIQPKIHGEAAVEQRLQEMEQARWEKEERERQIARWEQEQQELDDQYQKALNNRKPQERTFTWEPYHFGEYEFRLSKTYLITFDDIFTDAAQRATANDKRTPEEINAARIIELAKLRGVDPEKIQEAIVGSVEHPEDAAAVSKKLDEWLAIIEKNGGGQA